MKNAILVLTLLVSVSGFATETLKGRATLSSIPNSESLKYLTISGEAAANLYDMAAASPDDVDSYDGGISQVYKNDLSCVRKATKKTVSYSCTIVLDNGKAIVAPRG